MNEEETHYSKEESFCDSLFQWCQFGVRDSSVRKCGLVLPNLFCWAQWTV